MPLYLWKSNQKMEVIYNISKYEQELKVIMKLKIQCVRVCACVCVRAQ
jgi:hypothetical protein